MLHAGKSSKYSEITEIPFFRWGNAYIIVIVVSDQIDLEMDMSLCIAMSVAEFVSEIVDLINCKPVARFSKYFRQILAMYSYS